MGQGSGKGMLLRERNGKSDRGGRKGVEERKRWAELVPLTGLSGYTETK